MVEPVSILASLAAAAVWELVKSGYAQAKGLTLGSEQERALRNVLEPALISGLDESMTVVDPKTAEAVWEVLDPWFHSPEVQEEMLAAVIEVRDPDVGLLHKHYDRLANERLQDPRLSFDIDAMISRFQKEVHASLGAEIAKDDSKLVTMVNSERIYHILANQQAERLQFTQHHVGSSPGRPERLVGRDEILNRISENIIASADGGVETVTVGGLPGIGKTTALSEICNRDNIREAFGSRRVWVSLGVSPDLLAVISSWSRSLGGPDLQEETSPTQAANRLRAYLADRKVLVVADDVYDADDAQALRVLNAGVFLVSSRSPEVTGQLSGGVANMHDLEALSPEDSSTLLFQEAPLLTEEDRPHVIELAGLLGGLPLFLKVAASMLESRKRSGLDVGSVVEKVKNGTSFFSKDVPADLSSFYGEQAKTLHALLLTSLEALDDDAKQAFAALGAEAPMPSTFHLDAAEALWDSEDKEELIEALVNQGLVQSEGEGRFSVHPVLSAWARTLLDESPVRAEEIRARHARHYMEILESASERYFEGTEGRTRAMRQLETERQNILRGWSWATENYEGDDETARLCTGYPDAAGEWFKLWLTERQQLELAEAAVQASRRLEDKAAEEVNLRRLALAQNFNGDAQGAISTCKQALELVGYISGSDEARKAEAQGRGLMGAIYKNMDRLDLAEEQIRKQIELSVVRDGEDRAGEDPLGEATARGNLVPVLRDRGKYPEAIQEATRAYEIYESRGDYYEAAGVRSNRGTVYHEQGDLDAAEGEHLAYRYMALQMNSKRAEIGALANLGNVKGVKGEPEEALRYYEEHLRLVKSEQRPASEIGRAVTKVAGAQAKLGTDFDPSFTFDNCLARYQSGLELFQSDPKHRLTKATTFIEMAEMHRDYERPGEALGYTDAALEVFEDLESLGTELPSYKADALFTAALSKWDSEDKPGAIEDATHAHQLLEEIDHRRAERVQEQLDEWERDGSE